MVRKATVGAELGLAVPLYLEGTDRGGTAPEVSLTANDLAMLANIDWEQVAQTATRLDQRLGELDSLLWQAAGR